MHDRPGIVVGLDGSPVAASVLAQALELAARLRASLVIVRAVERPAGHPGDGDAPTEAGLLRARQELEQRLAPISGPIDATEVRLGAAWKVLADIARERDADLVVIGGDADGNASAGGGLTATRLLLHAPCAVLVVPTPVAAGVRAATDAWPNDSFECDAF